MDFFNISLNLRKLKFKQQSTLILYVALYLKQSSKLPTLFLDYDLQKHLNRLWWYNICEYNAVHNFFPYLIQWMLWRQKCCYQNPQGGASMAGQLGHGDTAAYKAPKRVDALLSMPVNQVACGEDFTLCVSGEWVSEWMNECCMSKWEIQSTSNWVIKGVKTELE